MNIKFSAKAFSTSDTTTYILVAFMVLTIVLGSLKIFLL